MSKLKYIAAANSGTVWGATEPDGVLFHRKGRDGAWTLDAAGGRADVVAVVKEGEAWCINKDHQIFHLQNGKWSPVKTHSEVSGGKADAMTISADKNGNVWYAQMANPSAPLETHKLFYRKGGHWVADEAQGRAISIAVVKDGEAWCVNKDHQIFRLQNGKWSPVKTHSEVSGGKADAKMISADDEGKTVWYVQQDDTLLHRGADGNWKKDTFAKGTVVAVGSAKSIWHINAQGNAHWCKSTATKDDWEIVDQPVAPAVNPRANWTYTVTAKDRTGLNAVVMREYLVQEAGKIKDYVARIKVLNPALKADDIKIGQRLTMPPK